MQRLADTIKEVVLQLLFIKPSWKFILQSPVDELQSSREGTDFLTFFLTQLVEFLLQFVSGISFAKSVGNFHQDPFQLCIVADESH